ncbi:MAG: IclR family transcriptional regulator C-terminal domain-containing protein [Paracoccus sp. (in: a-proteobacteria)]|uniref:IclR family transcriptional regulator n=1 Tax=Paracoccus sp. TaxID=267 RepID=UPI0039E25BDE
MSDGTRPAKGSDSLMVQSVAKAFRVLEAFGAENPTMSLSQVAQECGMDMSAAQRFTHTLSSLGYLVRDPKTRQYELGVKSLELAFHYTRASRLVDRAIPVLQHLSKQSDETVNLTVLQGTEIVFISRFMSRHVLNTDVIIGTRLPAFCTAPGRAILSRLPDEAVEQVLAASDLRGSTPATPTDPQEIRARIAQARRDGYALALEEYFHGDASIAAPIMGRDSQVVGAVNIGASTARYQPQEFVAKYAAMIVAAARSISWV